jgi:oligosaccharide repeat unit polymerase
VIEQNFDGTGNKLSQTRVAMPRIRRANPLVLFVVIFLGYNVVGLLDTPWTLSNIYDKTICWNLFFVGLSGFGVAAAIFRQHSERKIDTPARRRTSLQLTVFFFVIFSVCMLSTIIISGGIPFFRGEERFGNSALAFNVAQLYGFWILVRLISDVEHGVKVSLLQPMIYLAGVLCFGYRTPILIFAFVILIYLITFRLSVRKAFVLGVVAIFAIVGFAAMFAAYRVSQNYDLILFFKNINFEFIGEHKYLLPFVPALAMFDFSQNTVSSIGAALHEHMYGQLFLSNYETFLPGKHWGARNIVGSITGARWVAGRPMSITPTLQGALYVDFGYVGVFVGFFVISASIALLDRSAQKFGALGKFSFCYFLTLCIMAIHNGYWDVGFVFFILFIFIIRTFDSIRALINSSHQS